MNQTKQSIIFLLSVIFCASVSAKHINEETAKLVGQSFLNNHVNLKLPNFYLKLPYVSKGLTLVHKEAPQLRAPMVASDTMIYYYVFNNPTSGFVIVAGDDKVKPVLGYSNEGNFDPSNVPSGIQYWLNKYKMQIDYAIKNDITISSDIQKEWTDYQSGKSTLVSATTTVVSPLTQTTWNQNQYYNDQCPVDYNAYNGYDNRCPTGCVATAMAQIMYKWQYPTKGYGSYSYTSNYRTEFADFGNTTYDWSSMPINVISTNSAVATLMYHCGVSVNMHYSATGSGANVNGRSPSAEYALKTYFGYNSALNSIYRSNYSDASWANTIQTELQAGRPVLYSANDNNNQSEGHAFVCDGYDSNGYFHFNFGWGGSQNDNYFYIGTIITNINNETQQWNTDEAALVGIQPSATSNYDLRLYSDITLTSNQLNFGDSFTASVNIANYGTSNFSGDITAKVYDNNGNYIDDIEIKTGQTIQSNYYNSYSFIYPAKKYELTAGIYYIQIYYRPTGGNWQSIADGSYTNNVPFSVTYSPDIQLYSAMNINPQIFRQGQSATVSVNLINAGSSTFYGVYGLHLTDFSGTWVQDLGTITESSGLPSNYHYILPFTFTKTITASPGIYILTIDYKGSDNNWYFAGPGVYQNPIRITVLPPIYTADQYEDNDTLSLAYNMPISFSSNSANVQTTGSNFHNTTDVDYYKVILPIGYIYTITPSLLDSYNSSDYSVDAVFAYSTDGSNWSSFFDTSIPGSFTVTGGTTVYFYVRPYFDGSTGTYLLQIPINRTQYTVPDAPINLTATSGQNGQVPLSWTSPANNGGSVIIGYKVYTSTNSGTNWDAGVLTNSTATNCTKTGLSNGTIYTFKVSAINSVGEGSTSSSVLGTPSSSLAVPIVTNESINIYPNPTPESFHVYGFTEKALLIITDINGIEILAKKVLDNESVPINNLPKGVYIVKIITDEEIVERKLIKK